MGKKAIVLTTINTPAPAVLQFAKKEGFTLFISGDKKSPPTYDVPNVSFLSFTEQTKKYKALSKRVAQNHYARKNFAYLEAITHGAEFIYETDDDNFPNNAFPNCIEEKQLITEITSDICYNVFQAFTKKRIWPRGLPLRYIDSPVKQVSEKYVTPLIQQSLIDRDPDVDAIYRLTVGKLLTFEKKKILTLAKGTYGPFNTQSTYWHKKVFPLMYLPSSVTSRTTDIWRGYIAQRILWEIGSQMVFLSPCVYQKRNVHDFMNDFEQEVDVYVRSEALLYTLNALALKGTIPDMMRTIYEELTRKKFFKPQEVAALQAWLAYFS